MSRQDGRRAAGLVGSKGSPLYGQPQWWGEGEGEGEGEGRRGDVTRSSLASSLPGTGGEEGRGKRVRGGARGGGVGQEGEGCGKRRRGVSVSNRVGRDWCQCDCLKACVRLCVCTCCQILRESAGLLGGVAAGGGGCCGG